VELKTGLVEYGDIKIVLREANALDGMRRIVLIQSARQQVAEEGGQGEGTEQQEPDVDVLGMGQVADRLLIETILRRSHANCTSCMSTQEGLTAEDLTFEGFCRLPEALVTQWEEMALKLNRHWRWWSEEEAGEETPASKRKKKNGRRGKKRSISASSSGSEVTRTTTETDPGT
jgi:hypothetical protein